MAITLAIIFSGCDFTSQNTLEDGGTNALILDAGSADAGRMEIIAPEQIDAGCTPQSCDPTACGNVPDGCGGTLTCTCETGLTCGGAGIPGRCGVPLCQNGKKDPSESDVDCGGTCSSCAAGKQCLRQSDCVAGNTCEQKVCLPGVWQTKAPMPTARLEPAAVVDSNGRIWVLGGFETNNGASSVVEVYNPQTDSWTSAPPMLRERYGHTAIIGKDGRLYVFGGQYDNRKSPFVDGVSKTAEVYDFTSMQWSHLPDLPDGRMGLSSAQLANGNIMLIGGLSVNPIVTFGTSVIFSPGQGSYSAAPSPMLTGRTSHASAQFPDGRILVAGGNASASGRTASAEFYDVTIGGWTSLPPMPFANSDISAAVGPANLLLVFGGNAGSGNLEYTLVFEPTSRRWGSFASMPTARRGTAAVTTPDGRIWVIGVAASLGFGEGASDKMEMLTL